MTLLRILRHNSFHGVSGDHGVVLMDNVPNLEKVLLHDEGEAFYYYKYLKRGKKVNEMGYDSLKTYVKQYSFYKAEIVEEDI